MMLSLDLQSEKKSFSKRALPYFVGATTLATIAGIGVALAMASQGASFDELGCLDAPSRTTVFQLDSSVMGEITASQNRDIEKALLALYDAAAPNDRVALVSNAQSLEGSILDLRDAPCRPPADLTELAALTDRGVDRVLLERSNRKSKAAFEREAKALLERSGAAEEIAPESFLFRDIAAVSRGEYAAPLAEFHWVTDGLAYSDTIGGMFCQTRGAMPPARVFMERPFFVRLKPESFEGVAVTVYLLEPKERGPYCVPGERTAFWRDYFTLNGASSVDVIHLHRGSDGA